MNKTALSELTAVMAVATHRSFRGAAAEIGLSPSALSHAVATLEARMGVRLFHRTTRSVSLTDAGQQFLARVGPALQEISAAMDDANAHRDTPTGTLRINASEAAARELMDPIVYTFLHRYPDMALDIVTEGRFVDIVAEGFDAGIRAADAVPQDMIAVPYTGPIRFAVVGSPEYFATGGRKKPRVPDDLHRHICIRPRLPHGGPRYKWSFSRRDERIDVEPAGALTLDSSHLIRDAALRGMGLAWVNDWTIADDLASGRLVEVLKDWSPAGPELCLYYPGHRHVPAGLRAFIEVIREHCRAK